MKYSVILTLQMKPFAIPVLALPTAPVLTHHIASAVILALTRPLLMMMMMANARVRIVYIRFALEGPQAYSILTRTQNYPLNAVTSSR